MSESGKIDDPVEASFEAWPEESGTIGAKANELALGFVGLAFGPARVWKLLKDQFSGSSRFARIEYLLNGFRLKLNMLESEIGDAKEQIGSIKTKLESEKFGEAVMVACEESVRSPSVKKIDQLASVLTGSLTANEWADPNEDVGVMIRDIAQLGERDLKVLGILATVHAPAIKSAPNLFEPDAFSRETGTLMRHVAESGIHPDDFLSTCERLGGFGLAAEVPRNTSHMASHDYCYRPTRRGLALLSCLDEGARRATAGSTKRT